MAQRKPRLLSRITRKKPKEVVAYVPEPYIPPVKTEVDVLYDLIDERSCYGYRFCENYISLPWIRKEDIEDKGNGLFIIRFRCPVENERYGMPQVVKEVCDKIGSGEHLVYEKRKEFGLPFIEAAWVLQRGELHASEWDFSKCGGVQSKVDEHDKVKVCGEENHEQAQGEISDGSIKSDPGDVSGRREEDGCGDGEVDKGLSCNGEEKCNRESVFDGDGVGQTGCGEASGNLSEDEIRKLLDDTDYSFA